jgi:hypothetical protein
MLAFAMMAAIRHHANAAPGAALIVIEAEFVLGGLEAVFDGATR